MVMRRDRNHSTSSGATSMANQASPASTPASAAISSGTAWAGSTLVASNGGCNSARVKLPAPTPRQRACLIIVQATSAIRPRSWTAGLAISSLPTERPAELAKGFGFLQSKPATAFGPVAVTPDELGAAWRGGRVHLNLESIWNGKRVGLCAAGDEMTFHFGQLIAHLAKTRNVRAGSIVGSGTVSNKDWSRGYSCIAEKRAIETIESGAPKTRFMQFGDTIRIEMKGEDGASLFGAIEQRVAPVG